jgi:YVTN family beta-propeller protein
VIDATTNTVVGPIDDPCFSSPEGIVADPTRSRVYLINRNVNGSTNFQVCVIDTTTNTVVATANVGSEPRFGVVTPDGAFLYTSNNASANVSKVDLNNLASVTTIATGGSPRNMALSNDGSKVYVATQSDEVVVVTVATNGVSSITVTGAQSLYGVTVIPGTTFGYATDEDGDVVYVWDANTDTEVTGAGFPITGNFDTPRAIASVGDPVVPPPPPPPPAPVVLTPTFTG